ncbi:hypothetical protein GJ496_002628 [Pomphorhynchus laevis]|nr:hypothetical protein GJ496_002628 [Pomphorhynchus laevis]
MAINTDLGDGAVVLDKFICFLKQTAINLFGEIYKDEYNSFLDIDKDGCITKFLVDHKVPVLVIHCIKEETDIDEGESGCSFMISNDMKYSGSRSQSVAFVKSCLMIESDKPFQRQMCVFTLEGKSPYQTLHSVVSSLCAPFLKSYVIDARLSERDGDKMVPALEKKFAEIEMGLLHLQQNIDIPEVNLTAHPVILEVIKKCSHENRKPTVDDFAEYLENSNFMNQLHTDVNRWVKEIQEITRLDRDPSSGTAMQEITFWVNLERVLNRIQERRESLEITLTLDILRAGKRFIAVLAFDSDTGLKETVDRARNYNILMKDFPLNDLLSATEITKMKLPIQTIFTALRRIRNTQYPLERGVRLIEAISRDLTKTLIKVLSAWRLMHLPYNECRTILTECLDIFKTWDDEYERFLALIREATKKKKQREDTYRLVRRTNQQHKVLQDRLDHLMRFRHQHDQLRSVIVRVLRPHPGDLLESSSSTIASGEQSYTLSENLMYSSDAALAIYEVMEAYRIVKEADVLDISKEGDDVWGDAMRRYDQRIDSVETKIATTLREQLNQAKNASEMFNIFSRFNALFVRPQIRGAISEYQSKLLQRVKADIDALREKFMDSTDRANANRLLRSRDIPPVSATLTWVKQIERQLHMYLKRVEDVIGKGWENHVDGIKLRTEGEAFLQKLNAQAIFDDWKQKVMQKDIEISGVLLVIEGVKTPSGQLNKVRVNFSHESISLYKEVRNMRAMGFRIPLAIMNKAYEVNRMYPYTVLLDEAVHGMNLIMDKISNKSSISMLVAEMQKMLHLLIEEGVVLTWESFKLESFVYKLAECVGSCQEKIEELFSVEQSINGQLKKLEVCDYDHGVIKLCLSDIQKSVDSLSFKLYSNVDRWVYTVDLEIEKRLVVRLENAIVSWTRKLLFLFRTSNNSENGFSATEYDDDDYNLLKHVTIKPSTYEIRIANQVIAVYPAIENGRDFLFKQFQEYIATILTQFRIQSGNFTVSQLSQSAYDMTYKGILRTDMSPKLRAAYDAIILVIKNASEYIKTWMDFQSLWDLQPDILYDRLGKETVEWIHCIQDIRRSRKTFDTHGSKISFGPIIVDYTRVQSKVNLKYDAWHKDVLNKFGNILASDVQDFYGQISKARSNLENCSLINTNTTDTVNVITEVQNIRKKIETWSTQLTLSFEGQKILERQRYRFPNTWLDVSNIRSEFDALSEILERRESGIQQQIHSLQIKILSEDDAIKQKTQFFIQNWGNDKPVMGELHPNKACKTLVNYESKLLKLKSERENVAKAKEALDIDASENDKLNYNFNICLDELNDLKQVWNELVSIWTEIDELRDIPWNQVNPRKLRSSLDRIIQELKQKPARMRNYAPFEYAKQIVERYIKNNIYIVDVKSESVKERHWRVLCKRLGLPQNIIDLTLGKIWDCDLQSHDKLIKEIMTIAQGEKALEEFLRMISETWKSYTLDLVQYQNKCKIVRSWEDILEKLKEHLSSLSAMRNSPYFKEFAEEAASWDNKLERINALVDVWIDVQRRWVYLDGIFAGATDISSLLPIESQRFRSVNSDFLNVMQKIANTTLLIDILSINGIQKTMERLLDILNKIQKALGEYLEKERESFPRFYFVGDEDLLEVIGNTKSLTKIQKHLKKMFAGVHTLITDSTESTIYGVLSKEGEEVKIIKPIILEKSMRINDWLTRLDQAIRMTLSTQLSKCIQDYILLLNQNFSEHMKWINDYQSQLSILATQIVWTQNVEAAVHNHSLHDLAKKIDDCLSICAQSVLVQTEYLPRKKLEQIMIEFVYQRDAVRRLEVDKIDSVDDFYWISLMRFYFDDKVDQLQSVTVKMANSEFKYNFEYMGVQERLVRTQLTDKCDLTMTQALNARLGGSPFGPAGTGKTETVKALGRQLGRFVLVFNCDQKFDFQAMGRIFIGLCQVGAWGCFDEFNRLEEGMMSAVSQQIQTIQKALRNIKLGEREVVIELLDRKVVLHSNMAIFVTMNPGYAGRSNLPDNLKKLFRSFAMTKPDSIMIAQVMLYAQGFCKAETLAKKVVPFFELCNEQLSNQSHYDFGLRSLKNVLLMAGDIRRNIEEDVKDLDEIKILVQSIMQSFSPRLISEDLVLFKNLVQNIFPNVSPFTANLDSLYQCLIEVCDSQNLLTSKTNDLFGKIWLDKVLQLHEIIKLNHGIMMIGNSGTGKTLAWRSLLMALNLVELKSRASDSLSLLDMISSAVTLSLNQCTVIDPKSMSKDTLYGKMDANIREWKDGLFTYTLRRVIDSIKTDGKVDLRHRYWIVFDGDVDPEWVENLNSVLDDNKMLTLPNGERLQLPSSVRILFEVQDLKSATLATISRCGMVWFPDNCVTECMHYHRFLADPLQSQTNRSVVSSNEGNLSISQLLRTIWKPFFAYPDGLVSQCLNLMKLEKNHVMDFTVIRAIGSLYSFLSQFEYKLIIYNNNHPDFPLDPEAVEMYALKSIAYCIIWAFAGDCSDSVRRKLSTFIREHSLISMPSKELIEYEVSLPEGDWIPWSQRVPTIEIETHKVGSTDLIIPTVDTIRHETLVYNMLAERRPLILCGPPGSGKTMTLLCSLRNLPDLDVVSLNFSSASMPELLIKSLLQYCEIRKTSRGLVMSPANPSRWVVLMCDEINLPDFDKYGTQRIISFIRGMLEQGGFYHSVSHQFIHLDRVQFVGACNPPADPGRKPLSHRFLRHTTVLYVDYSGEDALRQIYHTFNQSILKLIPSLLKYSQCLTDAMIELYLRTQEHFTVDMQPHYIYSPRELTRWVRGIKEAVRGKESLNIEDLIRIWAHEALRLFSDRLVLPEERLWTKDILHEVARKHFIAANIDTALEEPILYSNWLTKDYLPTNSDEMKKYVKARLKAFHEEELDVPLVLYDDLLDQILRIDRVFRQPQGHLLLIGISGSGKTTSTRFVAWINGLKVFQLKVHNNYTMANFDDDLRSVLKRCGCKGEKIAFIIDEDNLLEPTFLERMNTLLANGEVPGLFEGDEYVTLISQCKEAVQREGIMIDTPDELYRWFASEITKNLHVVITMNPSDESLKDKASSSPALFNRCVLNWFGDWTDSTLSHVADERLSNVDLSCALSEPNVEESYRGNIIEIFVHVHRSVQYMQKRMISVGIGGNVTITPRHYLDFIEQFIHLFNKKRAKTEEHQLHLGVGLKKIKETVEQVEELQAALAIKQNALEAKNQAASEKLQEMVKDQQEAEKQKVASEELKLKLSNQSSEIALKAEAVKSDLDRVEPAVREAKQAVQGIKKQHLVELRSLREPPAAVKLTSECICLIMGQEMSDWKTVRAFIVGDGFINSIVNFKTDTISQSAREKIRSKYLSNPDFSFERVSKGSHVCGPLYKWAVAQLEYSDMLNKVGPMRNELLQLESKSNANRIRLNELDQHIAILEDNISRYKEEYAELVREAQETKSDLQIVSSKVNRSIALLQSLELEQSRWNETTQLHNRQMCTIIGDVLLCSAFLAYSGYFDQVTRDSLWNKWTNFIELNNIKARSDLIRMEFLSNADQRLTWSTNGLPADQLCLENAIMLNNFVRYPLIIDPSRIAVNYLLKQFGDRKIIKTSFMDESFVKQLESSMRFGNPLLIQDVERYDPLLNPLLNKELHKISGRVLIKIGNQDIDFSPSFTVFLVTRDPTINISPNLCSKVTLVNFTVTQMSMEAQCLQKIMKYECPEVERKRNDLSKLQGEFQQRLRKLEEELLDALNEQQGRILDDDSVITRLEALKGEASKIQIKANQTEKVMNEIEESSRLYQPLCMACSSIYFLLQSLNQIHHLYQFSLNFLMNILDDTLLKADTDSNDQNRDSTATRLENITNKLFILTFKRVAPSLLNPGPHMFGILLSRIYAKSIGQSIDNELSAILSHASTNAEIENAALSAFSDLFNNESSLQNNALRRMIWTRCRQPHRFLKSCENFIDDTFRFSFFGPADNVTSSEQQLKSLVLDELSCEIPLVLCSAAPGYDASDKILNLGQNVQSIAMGSAEGCDLADSILNSYSKSGKWLLLKNVHLSLNWLSQLEKKLNNLNPHRDFRLFLSMQIRSGIPSSIIRMSRVLMFEPATGIVSNMHYILNSVSPENIQRKPRERSLMYLSLCWLHATLIERLRYVPIGWTKAYDFNDSDLQFSCDLIEHWIDRVAADRNNVQPDRIPWKAIIILLSDCVYGGRIDNEFDSHILKSFVRQFFNSNIYTNPDFQYVSNVGSTKRPDSTTTRSDLIDWANGISTSENPSPTWIGLSADADQKLMVDLGYKMLTDARRLSECLAENTLIRDNLIEDKPNIAQPLWAKRLNEFCCNWLDQLSNKYNAKIALERHESADPLNSFFQRENKKAQELLLTVITDLSQITDIYNGRIKQTNDIRLLVTCLNEDRIPSKWNRYVYPSDLTVHQWLSDFEKRMRHLSEITTSKYDKDMEVDLGLLITPKGYLTATRQQFAQTNKLPIEDLRLHVDKSGFRIINCSIYGALYNETENILNIMDSNDKEISKESYVNKLWLNWKVSNDDTVSTSDNEVVLPLYINRERSHLLCTLPKYLKDTDSPVEIVSIDNTPLEDTIDLEIESMPDQMQSLDQEDLMKPITLFSKIRMSGVFPMHNLDHPKFIKGLFFVPNSNHDDSFNEYLSQPLVSKLFSYFANIMPTSLQSENDQLCTLC